VEVEGGASKGLLRWDRFGTWAYKNKIRNLIRSLMIATTVGPSPNILSAPGVNISAWYDVEHSTILATDCSDHGTNMSGGQTTAASQTPCPLNFSVSMQRDSQGCQQSKVSKKTAGNGFQVAEKFHRFSHSIPADRHQKLLASNLLESKMKCQGNGTYNIGTDTRWRSIMREDVKNWVVQDKDRHMSGVRI
jgi:hypothetical protein